MNTLKLPALAALLLLGAGGLLAQNSAGTYRLPYADGTQVRVTRDHTSHTPTNRLDMVGTGGTGTYRVAAAGDGIIRHLVDTNTVNCTSNGCTAFNNYVWIEHPNGEWTKYSHMRTGTTSGKAGLAVGHYVCAGTYLGDEGDIGFASGQHLHFEVAVPDDPRDPINPVGGFVKGSNRIPRFCSVSGGVVAAGQTYTAAPCPTPELSRGVYRIPYETGTQVKVLQDHITHSPVQNRLDLKGTGGRSPYRVVAAAAGTIRFIVDTNSATGSCSNNNFVWIEHPNGEWTKYSHLQTGTATTKAGLSVGQQVCAGTYLGDEDDVGCASVIHLHFEVAVPDDPANALQNQPGGYIDGVNRIPVICDIPGNIFVQGLTYVAAPCSSDGCIEEILLPADVVQGARVYMAGAEIDSNNQTFAITRCGTVTLRAGNRIVLRPGFRSNSGSYLQAAIRSCNEMPGLPGCNLVAPGGR